jgi:iron complex outermembrane receptor protein
MKQKFNLTLILILIYQFSFSQKPAKDSIRLNEVVVTGTKTGISRKLVPLSVSQITQHEIENSGAMNILPALNTFTPGIYVTERNILGFGVSTGGSGSISIRGISSSPNTDVLVLIDGHPQYQGIFGHPLADAYVASDVEKVEIIRGPASILYGSNAMAGVINIITKQQQQEGFKVNLGASYGSFNTQKYFGTIGYKKNKLSLFASINHDQTDGIRDSTDFNINNGYVKVGYELNKNFTVTADVSLAKYNANDNGPTFKPAFFNIDITRGKTSLSIDNKFDKSEGGFKFYHNFGEHFLPNNKLPNGTISPFHSTDRNTGAMLFQTFKLGNGTSITAGTDFKQFGGMLNQKPIKDSLITVNELAVYAYAQQTLIEKLTLSAGLRLENNSKFGSELIPIGGITYNFSENTTFKTSVSKGFRSPTIMELYMNAPVPNPELQPERIVNYEIGWMQTLFNNRLNFELTLFKVVGKNMIVVNGSFPAFKKENTGSFSNQGIEFSAKYSVCKNLFLHANYSYVDLTKAIIAAPRQQFNISVNYNYKIWNLNISTQYIEKLYTFISPNPTIAPIIQSNYLLLNTRLSAKPLKQLEVFVDGNNLLNQQYQINYGYPMAGSNFNAGFNMKF